MVEKIFENTVRARKFEELKVFLLEICSDSLGRASTHLDVSFSSENKRITEPTRQVHSCFMGFSKLSPVRFFHSQPLIDQSNPQKKSVEMTPIALTKMTVGEANVLIYWPV